MSQGNRAADIHAVATQFQIDGQYESAQSFGTGHINDTYCAAFSKDGVRSRYILQRINTRIFRDPVAVMENIERVTNHLAAKLANRPERADRGRRVLTLVPSRGGLAWDVDPTGDYWRAYNYIQNARSYDIVESPAQAYEAAKAFGQFQASLTDLPQPRLHDTLPDFHNTPRRFRALEEAVANDVAGRAEGASHEIDLALQRQSLAATLFDRGLPERVTHNDTKLSNVLLDDVTGESLCVIDLDTVMPGLALYDFGDMVRTTTSPAAEDEQDLSRVSMQFPMFEALLRGYLFGASSFLIPDEKRHLVISTQLITFEQGIRFLTDHLSGDVYYKIDRVGHNLDRCRTQFKLLESIDNQSERMARLVEQIES